MSIFGYEVVIADCGTEGFELFLQNKFDLVITDCQMPVIDGRYLLNLIKEHSPHTPVLMIKGQSRDEILEKISSGQVGFLTCHRLEDEEKMAKNISENCAFLKLKTMICSRTHF
jgi:CheY-like chemotaxis protein